MLETLNATDVRRNWGQFNDDVVRVGPRFVKRNRDYWAALSNEQLRAAFEKFTFEVEFFVEEDGTVTAYLDGFDIVENGNNKDGALDLIADELIEYANEYNDNFNLYFHTPDRRAHFPYIMNVLVQENAERVKDLIQCPAGGS